MEHFDHRDQYNEYKQKYFNLLNVLTGAGKQKKPNINEQLSQAIKDNDIEKTTRLLKNKSIDIDHKDKSNNTVLHLAVTISNRMVELLLKNKAKVNTENDDQETALHIAISSNLSTKTKLKIVELLIDSDVKINKKDNNGNTALHLATIETDHQLVEKLLEEDAKTNIKNDNNNKPIDIINKFIKSEADIRERKQLEKIARLLDHRTDPRISRDNDYVIFSPTSSASAQMIFDDSVSGSASITPTQIIISDDCQLDFNQFIREYFKYNANVLFQLLQYEGQEIPMKMRCKQGVALPTNTPSTWTTHWREMREYWTLYTGRLDKAMIGQTMYLQDVECWHEPQIDFYLLFLMYRTRELVVNRGIRICPERILTGADAIRDSRHKVFINPSYNLNIYDGSDNANKVIRRIFEDLIVMLTGGNLRSYLQVSLVTTAYMQGKYLYLS
jgi:hypothetical protein